MSTKIHVVSSEDGLMKKIPREEACLYEDASQKKTRLENQKEPGSFLSMHQGAHVHLQRDTARYSIGLDQYNVRLKDFLQQGQGRLMGAREAEADGRSLT